MRRLFLSFLALGLACAGLTACGRGGTHDAFTDSRIPPGLDQRFYPPAGWAWGLIQIGETPPVRYGVAAPSGVPRGDILILAGYGEAAEDWMEPAGHLIDQGYVVWVLDQAGQGGSGRYAAPHDLGHAPSFQADEDALRVMVRVINRPILAVIAQGEAAPAALTVFSHGVPARGLILSSPVLALSDPPVNLGDEVSAAPLVVQAHLGWLRAPGQKGWTSKDRLGPVRPDMPAHWRQANPDLRMGGVSWGWTQAFAAEVQGLTPARLKDVRQRVLLLRPDVASGRERAQALCAALPRCEVQAIIGGAGPLHLEADAVYQPWLSQTDRFIAALAG